MGKGKIFWLLFAFCMVAVIAVVATVIIHRPANNVSPVVITNLTPDKLPEGFPKALAAIEPKAPVAFNYSAVNSAGERQVSRQIISASSTSEDSVLYEQALRAQGWNIASTGTVPAGFFILADKNTDRLNVHIFQDPQGHVRVDMSLILGQ